MISQDLAEGHIHRFNGIGGVDGFADVRWESEEGNDPVPVIDPGFANRGVLLVPAIAKVNQGLLCLGFSRSSVDRFQVSGNGFAVFVGDIAQ